jgi:hypothetical protein
VPVKRYRSVEDMREPWREREDPRLWAAISGVWKFAQMTCPLKFPRGVYKHRSMEEANRLREQWEAENVRRQVERHRRDR